MHLHKVLWFDALKWRYNSFQRLLDEDCVESILIAESVEHVQLDQSQAMSLAIFKFLVKL